VKVPPGAGANLGISGIKPKPYRDKPLEDGAAERPNALSWQLIEGQQFAQERAMLSQVRRMHDPSRHAGDIFGVAFNPATGSWSAFNEDTLTSLSEHRTESEAHAACRRYEMAALRRQDVRTVLVGLGHRAI
jgi:hypothetical protein